MRFVLEHDDEYFKDQQGSGMKYSKYILILKIKIYLINYLIS